MVAEDSLLRLHRAMLAGDPRASERLADALAPRLRSLLRRRHAAMPRECLEDAAVDALLAYLQQPERYDPARGSLLNYLTTIADRRISDFLRRQTRRPEIFVGGSVELEVWAGNHYQESLEEQAARHSDPETLPPECEALLREILPDPTDRRIWELVCRGRTAVAGFAALLDIAHLPPERQKAEVKRRRDKVVARIRRRRREWERLLL